MSRALRPVAVASAPAGPAGSGRCEAESGAAPWARSQEGGKAVLGLLTAGRWRGAGRGHWVLDWSCLRSARPMRAQRRLRGGQ